MGLAVGMYRYRFGLGHLPKTHTCCTDWAGFHHSGGQGAFKHERHAYTGISFVFRGVLAGSDTVTHQKPFWGLSMCQRRGRGMHCHCHCSIQSGGDGFWRKKGWEEGWVVSCKTHVVNEKNNEPPCPEPVVMSRTLTVVLSYHAWGWMPSKHEKHSLLCFSMCQERSRGVLNICIKWKKKWTFVGDG